MKKLIRMMVTSIFLFTALGMASCAGGTPTGNVSGGSSGSGVPAGKEYYTSKIGMWYTVWWQSSGEETPAQYRQFASHWNDWSRLEPVRGFYSSGDPDIIKEHFTLFKQYGIDYLIIDDTNGHMNDAGSIDYNITQLYKVADEMGPENAPQLAIALGGSLSNGGISRDDAVQSRNLEAGSIKSKYVDAYPELYFSWKGKPLLVSYGLTKYFDWDSPLFTVRHATGSFYEAYFSAEGVPSTGFWGWVFSGESDSREVYGVIPGFNKGAIPSQTAGVMVDQIKRRHGEHYMDLWLKAIQENRETIVITSWNDFAEEPAIEAAKPRDDAEIDRIAASIGYPYDARQARDKLNGDDRHNVWLDYYGDLAPYWYEEITWAYASLKTTLLDGYYYREDNSVDIFQYLDGNLVKQTAKPHGHPVIRIPAGYFEWFAAQK